MSEKKLTQKPTGDKKKKRQRGKFLRDAKSEFKKISWPSKKQVWNNVLVVLVTVAIFAVVIWSLDYVLAILRDFIIGIFS